MNGYAGKILRVDLTQQEIKIEQPPEDFYRRYVGGHGFVAYYLLKELPPDTDPLGPENLLIFANGPFTGAPFAGAGRNAVGAKSPLTGGYGEADAGGFFGAELKKAGYDAIVIRGKAAEPVYLWIQDSEIAIRPAVHLWGSTAADCERMVKTELGQKTARVALIGPGGEKLVRYACILNDLIHAAGRTGLGAVMGSKNLKCIVAKGTRRPRLADAEKAKELGRFMRENWREFSLNLGELGTAGGLPELNEAGALPTRNFQDGRFEGSEKISGKTMRETILTGRDSCHACPVRCKRVVAVDDADYQVDKIYGGPEYETVGAFGSNCGVDDLRAVAKANELCNAYGVDTISTGMAVSFAMECYENGLLSNKQTGGLELHFGNGKAMVELTRQICVREGLGDLLAEGYDQAAEQIGADASQYALAVKGQPLPMHECRTRHGQALGYAVSPTGADHMHNFWDDAMAQEELGDALKELGVYQSVPQTVLNGQKIRAYLHSSNWQWLGNSLGLCAFIGWKRSQIVQLFEAVTGWHTNLFELMKAGERGVTMARIFNLRQGLDSHNDVLPPRMSPSHVSGSLNEKPITAEDLKQAVSTYYGMMGWNTADGMPTAAKLKELDVEWLVE